jgi:biotin carboxylase
MKSALVIAGGIWQEYLVRFLKQKGYYLYIVNPVETATVRMCDNHVALDIKDADAICRCVESFDQKPAFVVSDQSDVAVRPVAELSAKLGLPGNPLNSIDLFTDKNLMYDQADKLGIPVLPHRPVKKIADALEFFRVQKCPIVIKPADSTNSRGFSIISREQEIEGAFAHAMQNSPGGTSVAQRYCKSTLQLTAEGICSAGLHKTICFSFKDEFLTPCLSRSIRWPFTSSLTEGVREFNDRFVNASGLRFGITHSEYIVEGDRVWFNEIAARGGGYRISSDIVPWVSGVNVLEILHSNLVSEPPDLRRLATKSRSAAITFYRRDELKRDLDVSQVQAMEGVIDFRNEYQKQIYVPDAGNPRDCFAIVLGDDDSELKRRIEAMETLICSKRF